MIIREKYLSKIRPFYDQDLIKVIMGVRRCGKSVILLQIIDELKARGIPESQIIYITDLPHLLTPIMTFIKSWS